MYNVFKKLFTTMFNSTFRTIGRILAYLLFGLICMFIYNTFFKAETITTIDTPISSEYLDYFGRVLENSKYLNKDYIAFSHFCNENEYCTTLLLGSLQSGSSIDNLDVIDVDKLPIASQETLNQVYHFENKYYITEKQESDYTPIPLNEDLKGKTIYIKDLTDYFDTVAINHTSKYTNYADTSPSGSYINDKNTLYNLCSYEASTKIYNVKTYLAVKKINGSIEQRKSLTYDTSCIINSWNDTFSLNDYLSLTPFETTYIWKEFDATSLYDYICTDCDFITLGENNYYKTGIYDTVNIKGNLVYSNKSLVSLERSTVYEKIIALSLLLIICFSICYKLMFNK